MSIVYKYNSNRHLIKQGDIILFHGNKAISKIIRECDGDAYWNHIGIVADIAGVLFIIDSNAPGVHPERLSVRIRKYDNADGDFMIIRSHKSELEINKALNNVLNNLEKVGNVKYDYINGIKSLLNRYFKTKFKIKIKHDALICSMFAYPYELELDAIYPATFEESLFFPQDTIRYKKSFIIVVNQNQ
jgi:hypothetical protein